MFHFSSLAVLTQHVLLISLPCYSTAENQQAYPPKAEKQGILLQALCTGYVGSAQLKLYTTVRDLRKQFYPTDVWLGNFKCLDVLAIKDSFSVLKQILVLKKVVHSLFVFSFKKAFIQNATCLNKIKTANMFRHNLGLHLTTFCYVIPSTKKLCCSTFDPDHCETQTIACPIKN